jgi:hypothetical protein
MVVVISLRSVAVFFSLRHHEPNHVLNGTVRPVQVPDSLCFRLLTSAWTRAMFEYDQGLCFSSL